jgi:small subunit ribosomal protein S18
MARNNDRDRSTRRAPKDNGRRMKKKVCIFCKDRIDYVDYKDVNLLRKFMSDRGKIRARRVSGNCAQHQREVAVAIKTSRELALLPYTQRTTTERPGGRGAGRGGRGGYGGEGRPQGAPVAAEAVVLESPDLEEADEIDDADVEVAVGTEA